MYWYVSVCIGTYLYVFQYIFWYVLVGIGCIGMYLNITACIGPYWHILWYVLFLELKEEVVVGLKLQNCDSFNAQHAFRMCSTQN